jgi:NDP-sugar pyrophosphorylase family protein
MILPPVCILAGGVGSRLGDAVRETPKPLLEVAGEPFLCHQLRLLAREGAREVVLCVGYLGDRIESVIGQRRFGLHIAYVSDPPDLAGTAGAIRGALSLLGDRFLVMYGDTYLRIDYRAVDAAHRASRRPALMTVLRNDGRWDTSNVVLRDGMVVRYDKQHPTADMRWIDYGLGALTASALDAHPGRDLADVYRVLADEGQLAGYEATERFYEIGTPAALAETDAFLLGQQPIGEVAQRQGR